MERHLQAFLIRDMESQKAAGVKPAEFELELSGELPGVSAPVRGRADRIDVGPAGFRVVDYKTSVPSGRLQTRLMRSKALQLAFYLELAAPKLGLKPAGAALAGIEEEAESVLDAGEWLAIRAAVLRNVAGFVEQMRAGEFFIHPSASMGHCEWCSFSSACRKTHGPSVSRSKRSASAEAYGAAVGDDR
jgi:RecB family exonuclease